MSTVDYKVTPRQNVLREVVGLLSSVDRALSCQRVRELIDAECSRCVVSNALSKLVSEGLAEKTKSPTDGRVILYRDAGLLSDVECENTYPVHIYNNNGYRQVHHHHDGEKLTFPVHRLVAVAEYGYDEVVDKEIHHKNKHPLDNRPENLIPLEKSLHKKADTISKVKMSTTEEEFRQLLELAENADG